MREKTVLSVAFCLFLCLGCRGGRSSGTGDRSVAADSIDFKAVTVPAIFQTQQEKLEYVALHFWDNYVPEVKMQSLEANFANWVYLSSNISRDDAAEALHSVWKKDSLRISALADKYLYDPNSPYRDEDIYGLFAEKVGGELEAVAKLCALNRVGTKANDFVYETARGRRGSLYRLEADYILLFFSNPFCHSCAEIIQTLKSHEGLNRAVGSGKICVLNVYIDEDLEQWRSYLPNYPKSWINAFDPLLVLRGTSIYNIRAIPSLYLLDSDRTVLFKDAPLEIILTYLQDNGSI